jgi:hypothetical protein
MNRTVLMVLMILLALMSSSTAAAETIRGPLAGRTVLATEGESSFSLHIEELAAVEIIEEPSFIEGFELKLVLPGEFEEYKNSLALYIYRNVTPTPSEDRKTYSGKTVFWNVLPSARNLYYRIPLRPDYSFASAPGTTVIEKPVKPDDFPLIITILPVMKGIPDSLYTSPIQCKVMPLVENRGMLELRVQEQKDDDNNPEDLVEVDAESITMRLDNRALSYPQPSYILESGIHTIHIESEKYQNKEVSFSLKKGEVKKLNITLKKLVPEVTFEAPENSEAYLDGEKIQLIQGKSMEVSEGDHTILFKLGDYSLSKRFHTERGKSYIISLLLDISIKEK